MPNDAGHLWVCHECELIGSNAEAERHVEQTNHRVDQLDAHTTDAVRGQQHRERFNRIASLALLGNLSRAASRSQGRDQ